MSENRSNNDSNSSDNKTEETVIEGDEETVITFNGEKKTKEVT